MELGSLMPWERLEGLRALSWAVYSAGLRLATLGGGKYLGLMVTGSMGLPAGREDIRRILTHGGRLRRPRQEEVGRAVEELIGRGLLEEWVSFEGRMYMSLPLIRSGSRGGRPLDCAALHDEREGHAFVSAGKVKSHSPRINTDGHGLKAGMDGTLPVVVNGTDSTYRSDEGQSGITAATEGQHSGITAASQRHVDESGQGVGDIRAFQDSVEMAGSGQDGGADSGSTGAAQRAAGVGPQGLRHAVAVSSPEKGGFGGDSGLEGLSIYIRSCSVVVAPAGELKPLGSAEGIGEGVRPVLALGPGSPAGGNHTEHGSGARHEARASKESGLDGSKDRTEPNRRDAADRREHWASGESKTCPPAGEPGPRARTGGPGAGPAWWSVMPSRSELTRWVEVVIELTQDFDSAKGFRAHMRMLSDTPEGRRMMGVIIVELKQRLAQGEHIAPGHARGKWVTTRFMQALKNLGQLPEEHYGPGARRGREVRR